MRIPAYLLDTRSLPRPRLNTAGFRLKIIALLAICIPQQLVFSGALDTHQISQADLAAGTNVAMCAQCHGTNGYANAGASIPSLAGMKSTELIEKMQAYKLSEPTSSVMARLARGLTPDQINGVANFYESLASPHARSSVSKN